MEINKLGEELKLARVGIGMRKISKEIGVSIATLSRVEAGENFSTETLEKVCKWLGYNIALTKAHKVQLSEQAYKDFITELKGSLCELEAKTK